MDRQPGTPRPLDLRGHNRTTLPRGGTGTLPGPPPSTIPPHHNHAGCASGRNRLRLAASAQRTDGSGACSPPPTTPITTTATHHHRHHLTPCSGSARVLNNLTRDPDATKRFIADAIAIAHEQNLTGFNIDFESGPGLDTVALSAFLRVRHFPAQFPPF